MAWFTTNWLELVGNALNCLCIYLIYKNSVWNWPVGIANCAMYIALFLPAKLYGDAGLQGFYIVLSLYGWLFWLFGKQGAPAPIRKLCWHDMEWGRAWVVGVLSFWGSSYVLLHYTNSDVPFNDAALPTLSLVATYLMARRCIQHWYVWIITNVGYWSLYGHKGLVITQWCQIGFLALSVMGLVQWQAEFKEQEVAKCTA